MTELFSTPFVVKFLWPLFEGKFMGLIFFCSLKTLDNSLLFEDLMACFMKHICMYTQVASKSSEYFASPALWKTKMTQGHRWMCGKGVIMFKILKLHGVCDPLKIFNVKYCRFSESRVVVCAGQYINLRLWDYGFT